MQFQLGEQPHWIGQEKVTDMPDDFVDKLLAEEPDDSLINRGYAVVKLDPEITALYSAFHEVFEEFSQQDLQHKKKYATLFEEGTYSANQYHGYSMVSELKDQYMMRCCGRGSGLIFPEIYTNATTGKTTQDLGLVGLQLYEKLDLLCRKYEKNVCERLGIDPQVVDKILDPINKIGSTPTRDGLTCVSDFMLPGMDNFHYFNTAFLHDEEDTPKEQPQNKGGRKEERFHNNHASHSDSGLMTVVVVTDEPGLEVLDQKEQCWIALEQLLHNRLKDDKNPLNHRQYATIFWADSYVYLKPNGKLRECLHRVASSKKERYSVVFKQRTSPTATAPRYQEDYELGALQLKALDAAKAAKEAKA